MFVSITSSQLHLTYRFRSTANCRIAKLNANACMCSTIWGFLYSVCVNLCFARLHISKMTHFAFIIDPICVVFFFSREAESRKNTRRYVYASCTRTLRESLLTQSYPHTYIAAPYAFVCVRTTFVRRDNKKLFHFQLIAKLNIFEEFFFSKRNFKRIVRVGNSVRTKMLEITVVFQLVCFAAID